MSTYRWRDNDLDNQLILELLSDNPKEERICELVRQGADELFTDKIERWLSISAWSPTGLRTIWGNIEIMAIGGITTELSSDFMRWRESHWDSWPDDDWGKMPKDFDRKQHNEWGRSLALKLRHLIAQDINIQYLYINADYEARQIRNVSSETIQL